MEKPIVTAKLPIEEIELAASIGAVMYILAEESERQPSETNDSCWAREGRFEATSDSVLVSWVEARSIAGSGRYWGGHGDAMPLRVQAGERIRPFLGLLAISLSLILWIACAKPAGAWWIFKHHHHRSDESADESTQTPVAPAPPAVSPPIQPTNYQSRIDRRLLPQTTTNNTRLNPSPANSALAPGLPAGIPTAPDSQTNYVINPSKLQISTIRVGLATGVSTAEVVALDGASLKDYGSGSTLATLAPQTRWSLKLDRQCLVISPKDWFQLSYRQSQEWQSNDSSSRDSQIRPAAYQVPDLPRFDTRSLNQMALRFAVGPFSNYKSFVLVPNSVDGQPGLFAVNGKFYRGNLIVLPQCTPDKSAIADPTGQFASMTKGVDSVHGHGGAMPLQIDRIHGHDRALTMQADRVRGYGSAVPIRGVGFNLINQLDIDDYLLSVVPSEMPSNWPLEALKAQAIAARTYACANLGKHGQDGYDLKDTTDDQVYGGVKAETSASNAAVCATDGIVMTYEGAPICAYFHSASGGITESAENVWSKPLPYLQTVMDYDQQSPHSSWNRTFSVDQLENTLFPEIGKLLSIDVVSRSPSRRAYQLLVIGSRGTQITNAETIRRVLKLPSTNFNVSVVDNAYSFNGRGFGHGLGLSQWGAKGLAEQGYNAGQILTYYYRNVSLERLLDVPNH